MQVTGSRIPDNDEVLNRCVATVVNGLRFAETTLTGTLDVTLRFDLPPARSLVGRKCSPTSTLPTALRWGIWLERLPGANSAAQAYIDAKDGCELKTWSDKRVMLELMLQVVGDGLDRVALAAELDRVGEEDAATLLRKEAMRRARTPQELWAIRTALLGAEELPLGDFRKAYRAANSDKARLSVVRSFLEIAPHHPGLRRRLFALLEGTGEKESLLDEVRKAWQDPLADATGPRCSGSTTRDGEVGTSSERGATSSEGGLGLLERVDGYITYDPWEGNFIVMASELERPLPVHIGHNPESKGFRLTRGRGADSRDCRRPTTMQEVVPPPFIPLQFVVYVRHLAYAMPDIGADASGRVF